MDSPEILIEVDERDDRFLVLSCGGGPLPEALKTTLCGLLTYRYVRQRRGADAYAEDGSYRPTVVETRYLYRVARSGRLLVPGGYLEGLPGTLASLGYLGRVRRTGWAHPRPDRYTQDWGAVLREFDFRPRQEECLLEMAAHDRGVIVAPAGYGKTSVIVMNCLLYRKARVHVVVDSLDILDTIYRRLLRHLPDVGIVGGGKKRWGRVTAISADSLHHVEFEDFLSPKNADIVLCDENHRLYAPTHSRTLSNYRCVRMYGFSFTPEGRIDGADAKQEALFGRVIFHMSYPEGVALGVVAPLRVEWVHVGGKNPGEGLLEWKKELACIVTNAYRNKKIVDKVRSFPAGTQVLVMARSIEHLVQLKQFLPEAPLCYDKLDAKRYQKLVAAGLLDPERDPPMNHKLRAALRERFEARQELLVLANDVWSTGVDFAGLDVLVRVDGRGGNRILDGQLPSRPSRIYTAPDGTVKQYGTIVDFVDHFDPTYERRSYERWRSYQQHEWAQPRLAELKGLVRGQRKQAAPPGGG